jgi:hypothetical protein
MPAAYSDEETLRRELENARHRFHDAFEEYGRLLDTQNRIALADGGSELALRHAQELMTQARRHYEESLKNFTNGVMA